ncbi:MAG: PDZ domain-containing protein [Chlamydiia bacterium]|nr:PDZ domain-containing protein [Chlamydiia bacterium]
MKKWIFLLFLACASLAECKMPHLSPRDVQAKMEELFRAHACYKEMSAELAGRSLKNFLEELDPTKTYFLEPEISSWLNPSEKLLNTALTSFRTSDFSPFYEIHSLWLKAVDRRNGLEEQVAKMAILKGVKSEEFKNLEWASSQESLEERLLRIKSLQFDTAKKAGEEAQNKFLQRLQKRRLNRQMELTGQTAEERAHIVLTCVLKSVASSLDAHTNYLTPNEANQFMIQVQQRLFGIGAQLRDDLDGLSVMRILENSPASQSKKIKINDKIVAVNHEPIIGLDITEAVELIRGEEGTSVVLTILRDTETDGIKNTETCDVELIRSAVVLEESRLETHVESFGDGAIATLRLFSFYQDPLASSAQDMRKALEACNTEHTLKGVILDLRGNAGGLLTQAVAVSGLFITKGIVVSVKDHTGQVQHLREVEGKPIWEGPLVILADRASASAAEIVAQTLQDYGRALVVGDDHTFGKGSFQTFTLDPVNHPKVNPQGEYKVTRGRYYTVSGKSPQLHGVQADIVIPGLLSQMDIGERFAKFPLDNEEIEPHFDDDLSDISAFHRIQLGSTYRLHLQPQLATYIPYLATLKKNSQSRITQNKNYQTFLAELEKQNFDSPHIDLFGQSDLQFTEALSIMKDLLFLMNR